MEEIGYINWTRAISVGRKIVNPGPKVSSAEISELVESLRTAAVSATAHVAEVTQLVADTNPDALVLDRASWLAACARSGEAIMSQIGATAEPENQLAQVAGETRAVQLGVAFAAISTRILGQFDPFSAQQKLLLVAPNIMQVERDLLVSPQDFRLWVCLHEETHRYQFSHAAWLPDHILDIIKMMIQAEGSISWPKRHSDQNSIIDIVLTPEQRSHFDEVTAVLSLLEGHADVMMDAVGTKVIPTLPIIRKAFESRRDRRGWSAVVGKLLGNDLKLAQYRNGAAFCNAVIAKRGVAGLNQAFAACEYLPTLTEIHNPDSWMERVG